MGWDAKKFRFIFLKGSKSYHMCSDHEFRCCSREKADFPISTLNQEGMCVVGKRGGLITGKAATGRQKQSGGRTQRVSSWKENERWAAENPKLSSSIFHLPLNSL